jgi:hypothetical protein
MRETRFGFPVVSGMSRSNEHEKKIGKFSVTA